MPDLTLAERSCAVCGAQFQPIRQANVYCSLRCLQRSRTIRARERQAPLPDVACLICKESFAPDRRGAKYCSLACRNQVRILARRPVPRPRNHHAECRECGKPFFASKVSHIFCTPTCKRRSRQREVREQLTIKQCRSCHEQVPRVDFPPGGFSCKSCLAVRASGLRRCGWCREVKELSAFGKNRTAPDGRQSRCRACCSEAGLNRKLNPARERARRLFSTYQLTLDKYEALLEAQGGGCAACGDAPDGEPLHVDHDHGCCRGMKSCGRCVRGLLCRHCNQALGFLKDSTARAEALALYLVRSRPGSDTAA